MKKLLVSSFALALALAAFTTSACSSSPQSQCEDGAATACGKIFSCYSGAELAALQSIYGQNESECKTKLSGQCSQNNSGCTAGKTYDSAAASQCQSDYKNISCANLKAGTGLDSCKAVCK